MAIDIIARGMIEESYGDISHLSEQIDSHTGNGNIHVTTVDKSKWNGYDAEINQNKSDISALYEITSSGETVDGKSSYTLTNAVDYPLVGLNLYGKSTQDGTPTPENPVDIVSVGDSGNVGVTACGKNLFNLTDVSYGTLENNEIILNWSGGFSSNLINGNGEALILDSSKKYVLSILHKGNSNHIKINDNIVISTDIDKNFVKYECIIENTNEVRLYVIRRQETGTSYIKDVHIEIGSTATTYEPYHGTAANITSALPLCGIPVAEGGNYTDSTGQQWVCDEVVYNADGTEKIIKHTAKIGSYNGETITTPYISSTGSLTTGATIVYALDTPQEIELTAAEMSALRQLQTFNGITNISNDGGADMSVKYCTNKMMSEYVMPITTGLQKQIDELKAAVLSLGGNV